MSIGKNSIERAETTAQTSAKPAKAAKQPAKAAAPKPAEKQMKGNYTEVETLKIGYIKGAEATTADVASAALIGSIRVHGILGPLMIGRVPDGRLLLLGGYKRLDAAARLRLTHVPAIVIDVADDREAYRLFEELHTTRTFVADIHEGKFMAAASIKEMPTYLL